jgi:hypothetical protein
MKDSMFAKYLKDLNSPISQLSDWEQKRELNMFNIYEVMERWGAWAAADNCGVDWKPIAAGFKGLIPHGKKTRQQCDDDTGIMIDCCVARLRKYKPEEYELIIAHFVTGISLRAIAKKRKCSDGTIRKELQTALGFVDVIRHILRSMSESKIT